MGIHSLVEFARPAHHHENQHKLVLHLEIFRVRSRPRIEYILQKHSTFFYRQHFTTAYKKAAGISLYNTRSKING